MKRDIVTDWLVPGERLEAFVKEDRFFNRQILVMTSRRAVLLTVSFFNRVQERGDKLWQQLESVHVKEYYFSAQITLRFLRSPIIDYPARFSLDEPWILDDLPRSEAHQIYPLLKEKERLAKIYVQAKVDDHFAGKSDLVGSFNFSGGVNRS